jgi:DMSO/TMAO reductase YedYZ molybdopterin-dependent catalytic subunit
MPIRIPPRIEPTTLTRRSIVDWLGKATVLALGGEALAACAARSSGGEGGILATGEGGADDRDSATGADAGDVQADAGAYPFSPGPGRGQVFDRWPERTVDRQDIEEILGSYRLTIDGMVAEPVTLSFAELVALPRLDLVMDFHCVEGWSVHDVPWNAVHLSTLLELVGGPLPEATHANFHTIGGDYNESLPLSIALEPHSMLAYGVGGNTLPLAHGFPLRVHVPRLLAYKSAKYVERIELASSPLIGYWVRAGYPYDAPVPDRRLRAGRY